MTLRTRLTAAFLLVVLVPLLVGGGLVFALLPRAVDGFQREDLAARAALVVTVIEQRCAQLEAAAVMAARAAGAPTVRDTAVRMIDDGVVDGLRVIDGAGQLQAEEGTVPDLPVLECRTGGTARTAAGEQLTATRRYTTDQDQSGSGVVVAALDLDDDWARTLSAAAREAEVVLLSAGRPVAESGSVDGALVEAALDDVGELASLDGHVAVVELFGGRGTYGALVAQRSRLDLQPVQKLLFPALVVGAGLLAAVIGSGLARATTRPLEELDSAASRVAGGDLTTPVPVRTRDEVGRLGQSFNVMTEELRLHVEALELSGRQLQEGVARLGKALSGTHDLDRILAVVLDTAVATTGARAGAVLMGGAVADELVLSVGQDLAGYGVPEGLRVPVGVGLSGEVARTGTPLRGRSGTGPGERVPGPGEPTGVAFVALPLMSAAQVVGVLLLWDRRGDEEFTDADVSLLSTFTSQATVAVDNVLLHEEARRLSVTDAMTGLPNYRGFTVAVGKEIERAARFRRPLALLLLDLDHFKLVNDVYGHQRGDAVLVELAARVRGQVRDVDTPARYGGEEFVVVLPETDQAGAVQAAERIRAAVRRRPFGDTDEHPLDITVSIGIAVFPDHGTTSTTLLRRADEALYAAKDGGRDAWRVATPEPVRDCGEEPSHRSS